MSSEWTEYLQALAQWYANEVTRAIGVGTGAQPEIGGSTPPPPPPVHN